MKCAILILTAALAATLFAQVPGPVMPTPPYPAPFPTALRLFLELSDRQMDTITQLNAEYNRFVATKTRRMNQVHEEIVEETAREPLDPLGLGVRYAELEATRRQLAAELARTRERIRAALTDPQRAKLQILQEALKLLPLYSEAVQINLLEPVLWGAVSSPGVVVGVIQQPLVP